MMNENLFWGNLKKILNMWLSGRCWATFFCIFLQAIRLTRVDVVEHLQDICELWPTLMWMWEEILNDFAVCGTSPSRSCCQPLNSTPFEVTWNSGNCQSSRSTSLRCCSSCWNVWGLGVSLEFLHIPECRALTGTHRDLPNLFEQLLPSLCGCILCDENYRAVWYSYINCGCAFFLICIFNNYCLIFEFLTTADLDEGTYQLPPTASCRFVKVKIERLVFLCCNGNSAKTSTRVIIPILGPASADF